MKTAGKTVNTVRLVRGTDWVSFTTEKNGGSMMQNSKGELLALDVAMASYRMGNLLADGWTVKVAA